MKKTLLALAALATFTTSASAQLLAYKQTSGGTTDAYTLPRTVVRVTVVTEREVVFRGPYAKYASQYLGISSVAQTDKQTYRLVDASVSYLLEPDPAYTYQVGKSLDGARAFEWLTIAPGEKPLLADAEYADAIAGNRPPFVDMGIDPIYGTTKVRNEEGQVTRTAAVEKSPEQMAALAADAIFTLRKRRFDLVSGELGEYVYGAGLADALKEMDRIEAEYLALFVGKRYVQRIVSYYDVVPAEAGKPVVACRFSETKGAVSDADLSARPLTLELTGEAATALTGANSAIANEKKGAANMRYRVPAIQVVRLLDGTTELARERVPVYQFGSIAYAPVIL